MTTEGAPPPVLAAFLVDAGLAGPEERPRWTALSGGVSSDLWRVDLAGGPICVKRALPRLKVAAEWRAPVSRNANEWEWLRFASGAFADHVPAPLAHDPAVGAFAMAYLDPETHPLWKRQLLDGHVDPATAAAVGTLVGRLHASSAQDDALAVRFATDDNFSALRLEPYLLATAGAHPALAGPLHALATSTAGRRIALVHGDVSPKNILVGPAGPVLLDAECAWFGDPAFDLAFCVNHLLLKCLVRPDQRREYTAAFAALAAAYLAEVNWEPAEAVEGRAAALLPGLLLARVDGKSPVEYVTDEVDKGVVRRFAGASLRHPVGALAGVAAGWLDAVESAS